MDKQLFVLTGIVTLFWQTAVGTADSVVHVVDGGFSCRDSRQIPPEALRGESASDVIQHAIDAAAASGGAVLLESGRYPLDRPLRMRTGVALRGSGHGTRLAITEKNAEAMAIHMQGVNGASVNDLTILRGTDASACTGIVLDDCGDCRVCGVLCFRMTGYGIVLTGDSFLCSIADCRLVDCGMAGVRCAHLDEKGRGGDYVPNRVSGCFVYGGGYGFECFHALVVNFNDNTIYQSRLPAFFLHENSNSVLVTGCRTYQIESDAVRVINSHEINLSNNMFSWHRGNGIVLKGVAWGSVTGNNVIDSGVRDKDRRSGIQLLADTRGVQVTGNAIFNWGDQLPMRHGVVEASDCRNNLIANNSINFCTRQGILSEGKGTIVTANLEATEAAYLGMEKETPYPDFTRNRLDRFLQTISAQLEEE